MNEGISVILCCYNSATRIAPTLQHLAKQHVPAELHWEIVLVDNNSRDGSADVARDIWNGLQSSIDFKITYESNPGLSNAREKGVQESRYDFLLFCDDDNWLDPTYVYRAFQIMRENPRIGALGGHSRLTLDPAKIPDWFYQHQEGYAVGKQGSKTGDVTDRGWLWGAGIVLRRSAYLKAYAKVPALLSGRKGSALTSHEDVEICKRFIMMGYRLHYSEDLFLLHDIQPERLTVAYCERLIEGKKIGYHILELYDEHIRFQRLSSLHRNSIAVKVLLTWIGEQIGSLGRSKGDFHKQKFFRLTGINIGSCLEADREIRKLYN